MKRTALFFFIISLTLAPAAFGSRFKNDKEAPVREVAITFDDLPSSPYHDAKTLEEITRKLLSSIKTNNVPAIGFVNEDKLYKDDRPETRIAILKMWVDEGVELGNHSYSHFSLYRKPLAEFEEDVIRGEKETKKLLASKGLKPRYFRHPFLNTGPNLETKMAFEKFLAERGYRVAPVTIDNMEWLFASVYTKALANGDAETMKKVSESYIPYMEEVFAFYEKLSSDLLGYEVKQILLLHANALNADNFDALAQMLKKRGYRFISLDDALKDKAYSLPDNYTGPVGISWLQRWAITKGKGFRKEPYLPKFMQPFDTSATGSDFKSKN